MFKYILVVCLVATVVVFQNCGNKEFSLRTDLNKSASLDGTEQIVTDDVPVAIVDQVNQDMDKETDDDDKDYVKDDTASNDDDDDKEYDDVDKDPVRNPTSSNGSSSNSGSTNGGSSDSGKTCKNRDDGNGRYVCIVAGPGKSQHIAVINDEIVANNSTPKTACISKNACENIVGAKFEVKSIEKRGYCKNGTPQVLVLTDVEVKALVDKIK